MYKLIIFDVDGTLIDTEKAVFLTYSRLYSEELGGAFTQEQMRSAYGVPTLEALTRLGFRNTAEAGKKYHKYLMSAYCEVKLFDGLPEVLERLKERGVVMGVATSRNKSEVSEDICLQGIRGYFKHLVCADDTQKHKPCPEPLLKLMEQAGASPDETLFIGDTDYDYLCARNAGVDFGLALWGAKNPENIEADYSLKEPGQILDLI